MAKWNTAYFADKPGYCRFISANANDIWFAAVLKKGTGHKTFLPRIIACSYRLTVLPKFSVLALFPTIAALCLFAQQQTEQRYYGKSSKKRRIPYKSVTLLLETKPLDQFTRTGIPLWVTWCTLSLCYTLVIKIPKSPPGSAMSSTAIGVDTDHSRSCFVTKHGAFLNHAAV